MRKHIWLLLLHIIPCEFQQVKVTQDKFVTVASRQSVKLHCHHKDSSYFAMFWYQQTDQQGLKLMVYSTGSGDNGKMEAGFESWSLERPDVLNSTLRLSNASVRDSAFYFCAVSRDRTGSSALYFGGGTILSVLENGEERKQPEVKVYRPNKKEFKEHNLISLVCVANGFYPEHVRLHWYMNGIKRDNIYPNVPQLNSDNKTYFTSKRLSLTRSEYFNPQNTFKCVAGFIDDESGKINDEIMGEADCSVSREQYGMSINQGKISYIMVMCKSGLYGIIILFIIWRRKVIAASK